MGVAGSAGVPDLMSKEVVVSTFGDWLSESWEWDLFVTLTHDPDPTRGKAPDGTGGHTAYGWAASESHWRSFIREVERQGSPRGTFWFRGREPNPARYGTHFHALIGGLGGVDVARLAPLREWWWTRYGFNRIVQYEPGRGAGHYVGKYVAKQLGDLTFSPNAGQFQRKDS